MLYLDASAALKLIFPEAESEALRGWMGPAPELVASTVIQVEIARAILRAPAGTAVTLGAYADQLLRRVAMLDVDASTVRAACRVGPPNLRTIDAIHVGTAMTTVDIDAVVTYDRRLADAARANGLTVAAPGQAA